MNTVFYKSATQMNEIDNGSVDLIITSPPYFNIKDYSLDGRQEFSHSNREQNDIGNINSFESYIANLLTVWKECEKKLKPNGKLCINVPLMPILKKNLNTHYNRHIYDIQSEIQKSILNETDLFLLDIYIWNRTNPTKKLMFGSYPYPRNFYAQNTIEFITIYVKDGKPERPNKEIKESSKLTKDEWVAYTKQIWNIPIPNKGDIAFGEHSAIMPEEIVQRLIKLFSFKGDVILDPFTGSGTTLKIAKKLQRNYVGYELYESYAKIIEDKLRSVETENEVE